MKKVSLLILSSLFAFALSATGRQPLVTINTSNDYEVKIDGRTYYGNNTIPNLSQGTHAVEVYHVKKQLLGKRRTLVSSSSFQVRDNDISIFVDNNGQLRINNQGNNMERRDRGRNDNDGNNRTGDRDNDDDDNRWNKKEKKVKQNNGNGRGKKKGHYK